MSELLTPGLGAPEPVAEPAPEPAEPAWAGPSQDEWGSVMGYIQQQQQQAEQYAQQQYEAQQAQGQQAPPIDFFADDASQQVYGLVQQAVQQSIAPLMEWKYGQDLGEAHNRAIDIIDDEVSRNGEFMLGEKAYANVEALANTYLPEESQRHGYGPKAAEAALARAAADWRTYESELQQKAIEQYKNQLTSLSGAPRDVYGAALAGSEGFTVPQGGDEYGVLERFGGFSGGGR